jgi:RNA polymerase sigma factor (sigma-70 family)
MNNKYELYTLIKESQSGNKETLMQVINKFIPLIKKYARKLNYEDADTDLIIAFIKIVYFLPVNENTKEDKIIVSYIAKGIRNEYIRLSKKIYEIYKREMPLDENIYTKGREDGIEDRILLNNLLDKLPPAQKKVIKEIYIKNNTESYVAHKLNTSRQAVCNSKRRALNNLKKQLSDYLS